jgi:hypothetical protein
MTHKFIVLNPFEVCERLDRPRATNGAPRAHGVTMSESNQLAAEHQDHAPHAHRTGAEHKETKDHLAGHESPREVRSKRLAAPGGPLPGEQIGQLELAPLPKPRSRPSEE